MKIKILCGKLKQLLRFRPKYSLRSKFFKLPINAIIMIARHTDIRTVCALMRTCKLMRLIIYEEFFEHRFKEASFSIEKNLDELCLKYIRRYHAAESHANFSLKYIRMKFNDEIFEKALLDEVFSKKKNMRKYAVWDGYGVSQHFHSDHCNIYVGSSPIGYHLRVLAFFTIWFKFLVNPGCYKFRVYGLHVPASLLRLLINYEEPKRLKSTTFEKYFETESFRVTEETLVCLYILHTPDISSYELNYIDLIHSSNIEEPK